MACNSRLLLVENYHFKGTKSSVGARECEPENHLNYLIGKHENEIIFVDELRKQINFLILMKGTPWMNISINNCLRKSEPDIDLIGILLEFNFNRISIPNSRAFV